MRVKRALALLLTVAMALSFMVFPVNATAPCTLSLSDAEATVTASAGQDVTVDVNISGLAEGEGWSALTLYVYYNSDLLTFKDYDYEDNGIWDVHTSSINKKGTNTLDVNAAPDAQDGEVVIPCEYGRVENLGECGMVWDGDRVGFFKNMYITNEVAKSPAKSIHLIVGAVAVIGASACSTILIVRKKCTVQSEQ